MKRIITIIALILTLSAQSQTRVGIEIGNTITSAENTSFNRLWYKSTVPTISVCYQHDLDAFQCVSMRYNLSNSMLSANDMYSKTNDYSKINALNFNADLMLKGQLYENNYLYLYAGLGLIKNYNCTNYLNFTRPTADCGVIISFNRIYSDVNITAHKSTENKRGKVELNGYVTLSIGYYLK